MKRRITITWLAALFLLLLSPAAHAETLEEQLNNLVGPTEQYHTKLSPVYLRTNTIEEQISPQNGELTITQTDYVLPGRNGLNVELKRIYKNGSSNVQDMKVKYVNGAWIDYVYSDAKTSSFYEDRYNLGIGTRFSFASMEIRANSDGTSHKFLHTESGDVYRLKAYTNQGERVYLPEGQTVQDVMVKETAEYSNGQADGTSKYVLSGNDGKKSYFTEDGRLVGIVDRYGNKLQFEYGEFSYSTDGETKSRKLMTQITDTIGRVITLEYKEDQSYTVKPLESAANPASSYLVSQNPNSLDSGDLEGEFQVVVHIPGGQTIVYDKSAVLVSSSKHVLRTRLQRVYDVDGQVKAHLWYEQPDLGFTYMNGSQYAVYNRYENLTQIDYVKTNRLKRYIYNTYTSGLNDKGSMQYRKVFERKDLVKTAYDSSITNFLERFAVEEKDKTHYTYTNEADGYGSTDYKKNDYLYLKDTYRYSSVATEPNGSTATYSFDGLHQLMTTERNGADHREVLTTERDEMKLVKKQETLLYQVSGGQTGEAVVRKVENFRYDQYGNLTNYTGPEAERDEKGYPVNSDHTVIYSYAYDKFHVMNQKTWKLDAGLTAQIIFDVDAKGNVVKETKVTGLPNSEPVVSLYGYDEHGNMIRKDTSSDQGSQHFVTEYLYGTDRLGTDTKGAYLTEERTVSDHVSSIIHQYSYDMNRGSLISEWDGNSNRTSYKYDALGRLLAHMGADGTAKTYEYREAPFKNLEIQMTDERGNVFLHEYDILGSMVRKDVWENGSWIAQYQARYDSKGNKTSETDANGHRVDYTYDSRYRLISKAMYENGTIHKGNVKVAYEWTGGSQAAQVVSVQDEEGYWTKSYYDIRNRLVKLETTADGSHMDASTYSYDYAGNMTRLKDANGHSTLFRYDGLGRLISRTDAAGYETRLSYNALNQVIRQEEPGGRITETLYDGTGRQSLIKIYQNGASGDYTFNRFRYDAAGNKAAVQAGQAAQGQESVASDSEYVFDAMNRLTDEYVRVDDASSARTHVDYDASGNKMRIIQYADAAERKYRLYEYQYDFAGRLTEESGVYREQNADGLTEDYGFYKTSLTRDAVGNVVEEKRLNADGGMDATAYAYNYRNQVTVTTMPFADGQTKSVRYQYNKTGRKNLESISVSGQALSTSYTYDGKGKLTSQTDALGGVIRYLYDAAGNRIKQVDARYGHLPIDQAPGMEYTYDANNRQVRVIAFDGSARTVMEYKEYDGRGNVVKEVDGEGYREDAPEKSLGRMYTYDASNRRITETSAQMAADNISAGTKRTTLRMTYDGAGNLLTRMDALGRLTRFAYYGNGLLKSRTDPDGLVEAYAYDLTGKAYKAVTNRAGYTTKAYLNIFDKPYRVEYADGTVQSSGYSPKGELVWSEDQNGASTYYSYDDSGNLKKKKEWISTDSQVHSFKVTHSEYDEVNRLTAAETFLQTVSVESGAQIGMLSAGDRTVYEFDKAGRMVRTLGPNGREVRQAYDRAGNMVARKSAIADGLDEVRRYEYDILSRAVKEVLLVSASDIKMDTASNAIYDDEYVDRLQSVTSYQYDKSGRVKTLTDPNGYVVSLRYDRNGQVAQKIAPDQATIAYRYDELGNLLEEVNPNGGITAYEYDVLNRFIRSITTGVDGKPTVTRYVLDAMGNVIREITPNQYEEALDRSGREQEMSGMSYAYDAMNRRLSAFAPDGTLLEQLLYDGKGQVIKQVDGLRWNGDMSSSPGTAVIYDGLGRVTARTNALGQIARMEYNVLGHLVRQMDARGYAVHYDYNADGTLKRIEYPDGGASVYTYDKLGRMESETNPLGYRTSYAYNAFGQVKATLDANGGRVENRTDLAGNVVASTDKRGSETLLQYDGARRLKEKRTPLDYDASGNVVYAIEKYAYDPAGNLIRKALTSSKEKSFSREMAYTYDPYNRLRSESRSTGAFIGYSYDANGNMTKRETLREADRYDVEKFEYDARNRLTREIRLVEKESLAEGERLASIPALQDLEYPGMIRQMTSYEYDVLGNKVKQISAQAYTYEEQDSGSRGLYTVSYAYDALNRLAAETRLHESQESAIRYEYDANGNRTSVCNERGAITRYEYDQMNRVTAVTDAEGGVSAYAYDNAGNKVKETNAKGYGMTYSHDSLNRLQEVTDPYGKAVTRYAYDGNGNVIKKMDAQGISSAKADDKRDGWLYEYDLSNRLIRKTNPELAALQDASWVTEAYRYNAAGEMVEKINALGHSTRYAYNEAGLLMSVTDAQGTITSYSYDLSGHRLVMTDGRGKATSYRYGAFGLLLDAVNPAGRKEAYRYDLALQRAEMTDGNGNHIRYAYDNRGLLLGKSVAETGEAIAYSYDETGNRASMTDASGRSEYAYDQNNRLVRVVKGGQTQLIYTYDAIGNVQAVMDKQGHETEYTYDRSSRMETVQADGQTTSYGYDANGNRQEVTYPGGVTVKYKYNKDYRLIGLTNQKADGGTLSQFAYEYDEVGQQISKTDSYGKTGYTYDEAGRITKVEAPGKTMVYRYDEAGNRLSLQETYTSDQPSGYTNPNSGVETEYATKKSEYLYSRDNQLLKLVERMLDAAGKDVLEKTTEYGYDGNGNELRQKVSYVMPHSRSLRQTTGGSLFGEGLSTEPGSSGGEASSDQKVTTPTPDPVIERVSNTFDGFNRLVRTERVKNGERNTIAFVYDGDGLRTQKTGKSSTNAYKPQVTNYLYDRQYVILETDGQGAASVRYVRGINYISRTSTQQTEEGNQGSELGAAKSITPVTAARISYFLYNGHGDVVQTVSREGEVENQYDYDVFGNPTLVLEEAYSSAIRYAGEFYDEESGLYYLRARYYNPYTGRFITEDSYWGEDENPLSLNRYTYVLNSPLMYWDPTGHWEQGDEKLNPEAQAKLIALTSAYYSAQTELEQDSIRGMAQAIRNDSHSKDTIVTPLQFYTKEIEAVNSEADASRGYMNAEEWFAALKTEGIGTSSTSIRVDEDNYSTSTTNIFGITHIGVQSSASYWADSETDNITGKSEATMSIKYKLEPNDAKFVYSSAREDVSLEQTLVVLELMKRNGGKLTKEQYKSAGIEVEPDRWDSKTGTHSFYEGNYQVSLHGYTMGDLNDQYIQENLRLEEIFGVFALRVSNEKDLTLTTKKADKVKVEERQAGITKEKEVTGETSSGHRYKLNLQQFGGKGTGEIPTWKGSGPTPGVLGVNSSSKSVEAIKNYNPKAGGIEFVFDPKTNTFVVGKPNDSSLRSLSPHQKLAYTISADEKTVVGGTFSRGPNGEIRTTENSGHYGQNWTPEVRKQFEEVMESYGLPVKHETWGK